MVLAGTRLYWVPSPFRQCGWVAQAAARTGPYRAGMHVVSQRRCLDTVQCWAGICPLHQLTLELMDHEGVWGRSGGVRVMVGTL